jgi:CPA2 family monovalent cation:H+ antiporter-2
VGDNFLLTALVFLGSAVILVPLAKKLGMGSVLGYLIAGILIGPFVFGFVGEVGQDIMHVAEFGVVMMLFIIGLELNPKEFWKMRRTIVGLGTMQMGLTIAIAVILAYAALGLPLNASIAIAMAVAMSSTAIVLQTLKEKGLSRSVSGQSSFAVLLFQDIMVIPALAILPLIAGNDATTTGESHSLIDTFPGWLQTLIITGAVISVILVGKYIAVPLLRAIAKTRLREMFTAASLLLVVGVALLMQSVGLSAALGTFLAGVVLANSEFRHELESDLEPFKGLLLGLFFISVGASINFSIIMNDTQTVLSVVFGIILLKALVLAVTAKVFGIRNDQNLLFVILLSQVGEFAFVILSFSGQLKIIDVYWIDMLMASTAISMAITPSLLLLNERVIDPYFGTKENIDTEKTPDEINEHNEVILVGFGHFGSTIGRFLRANGVGATILDNDSDRVELLRKMGFKVYYGDATRLDLLRSAGAENAKLFIAAIDNPEVNQELVRTVRKHFPNLEIMARARNRMDAYELIDLGVKDFYRETLYTSVHMAIDVLKKLGFRSYSATRKGMEFIRYDEIALEKLAKTRHQQKEYILNVREQIEMQERLLSEDLHTNLTSDDHAWDSEIMRPK